jgi:cell division protein ZapE
MGVRLLYEQALLEKKYTSDPAQLQALDVLERCEQAWAQYKTKRKGAISKMLRRPDLPRGVYMHGGVGRGKSFLMDCFFNALPLERKTRLHFHEFMREVHRELADMKGQADPLDELGRRMGKRHRLICFDEFHVADITDAMMLYRLLQALLTHRVSLIMTSNFSPDDLYPNGLHRDRMLPAIELLKEHFDVLEVDAGVDYRCRTLEQVKLYHTPLTHQADLALTQAFERLAESKDESALLRIEHREFCALRRAGGVVWFDFDILCGGPRSQNDYLELAAQFHTVMVSNVPYMPPKMASQARRFTWLVDVLYDRRVKLIISAAVAPEQLYTSGPLAHEFPRTVSRLNEMQSKAFLALAHRHGVDTSLT